MDKKAISGVVVAILLLLIAVIAVGIFWFALRPSIEKGTEGLGKGQECIILDLRIDSIDNTANTVKVSRGPDSIENLLDIKILVEGNVKAKTPTTVPAALESTTYTITDGIITGDTVEIAGVLQDGTLCPVADSEEVI